MIRNVGHGQKYKVSEMLEDRKFYSHWGIDIFGILVVGICALLVILTGREFLIDIAITWAILSFIATLTLAQYLSGKKLNE